MDIKLTRRDFLKLSIGSLVLSSIGINLEPVKAYAKELTD